MSEVRSMRLYEMLSGRIGESYQRCYAWAQNEEQATQLYLLRYQDLPKEVRFLFEASQPHFITALSDSGFDTQGVDWCHANNTMVVMCDNGEPDYFRTV